MAIADIRSFRTGLEDDRKVAKEYYIAVGRGIDDKAKDLTAFAEFIEKPLKKRKIEIEAIWEAEKKRKADEENRRYIIRVQELSKMGVMLDQFTNHFVLNKVQYEISLIRSTDDDIYKEMFDAFKAEFDIVETERLDKEKKDAEAKETLRLEQEKLKQEQAEFKKQQEELKRQQEEFNKQAEEFKKQEALAITAGSPFGNGVGFANAAAKEGESTTAGMYSRIATCELTPNEADKRNWNILVNEIRGIAIPDMETNRYKQKVRIIRDFIADNIKDVK